MGKSKPGKISGISDKWVALENKKIIAEGMDLAKVYVNAMIVAKSQPQFKKIPV